MFGTSGIRGTVGTDVTTDLFLSVGRALASEGYGRVAVGRDARASGGPYADALAAGVRECGANVVRLGTVSTPTVARNLDRLGADAGVSVTASHNPPEDNGLKLWNPSGQAFDEEQRAAISRRVREDDYDLASWRGVGRQSRDHDAIAYHVDALVDGAEPLPDLDVVVDVGTGTGALTADALARLGCAVTTLDAQPDGSFPARPSEPTAEHCGTLRRFVAETDADLGVAHDGDADRTMAVAEDGSFVPGDALLALFGRDAAGDGDRVAAPVDASLAVEDALDAVGASLVRTRVGDVYVAEVAAEPDVAFGGEPSGAWIWPDRTRCPDGPQAAVRLAELVRDGGVLSEQVADLPSYPIHRDSVEVADKAAVMDAVRDAVADEYGAFDDRDGVRVDCGDGWFLVRASGTQPLVRVTAEARTDERAAALREDAERLVGDARSDRRERRQRTH